MGVVYPNQDSAGLNTPPGPYPAPTQHLLLRSRFGHVSGFWLFLAVRLECRHGASGAASVMREGSVSPVLGQPHPPPPGLPDSR